MNSPDQPSSKQEDSIFAIRRWRGPLTNLLGRSVSKSMLGQVPTRLAPQALVSSICGFCATGCSLQMHMRNGEAVNLSADVNYPVNLGMACPKGWEALAPLSAPDRATVPLVRGADGKMSAISWSLALDTFCHRFKEIQSRHGRESVAFLSTGQIATEEMALLGSFAKFGMGVLHGDGNTRQCMATAAAAYKQSFGFDAPPYSYADFEQSDVLIFVGSNPCIAHPIMWQRVMRNKNNPRIIVMDPRKTETAMQATYHCALRPKSDLVLLYGLSQLLIEWNKLDLQFIRNHTQGFAEFRSFLKDYPLDRVATESGISTEDIVRMAEMIADGQRVSFWWTMGVNQSFEGTRVAQAIINLALMTGNIGRPGTGANSITGQCNAMGSRLFSNTTNLLGGHDFTNPIHRQKVASALQIPIDSIPKQASWAYDQIISGIESGAIRGLWVIATNPAHSWIHRGRLEKLRSQLEFLVVQDMYDSTETARLADLVLPAAGWGEKEGTFINSERRIGVIRKVRKAPGQALADFYIFKSLAEAWGCGGMFSSWSSPQEVFHLLKAISRGQPCDISGIRDYADIEAAGGIQWPLPDGHPLQDRERRLFSDGYFHHADGKARFCFDPPQPLPEPTCTEFPFTLLTGRGSSAQWHTLTRTAKSGILRKLAPINPYVEMNPVDASEMGIHDQDWVEVISRRSRVRVTAVVLSTIQPGQVFMAMHYPETNLLTHESVDPHSRQPSYKACAVQIRKM